MCEVDVFVSKLFNYLTNKEHDSYVGALIKRHNDKFEKIGEFSFPWNISAWRKHVTLPPNQDNFEHMTIFDIANSSNKPIILEDECLNLVEITKDWQIRIKQCKIVNDRIHVYIDRFSCIKCCLVNLQIGVSQQSDNRKTKVKFSSDVKNDDDLVQYRIQLICKVTENLARINNYVLSHEDNQQFININFTSKSRSKSKDKMEIFCAPVVVKHGSKENKISTEQFLEKRTLDMKLKAQHKYRVYVTDENLWKQSLSILGEASAKFDLLQIRSSHPVIINMYDEGFGCSKGASFILYNYARLSSIINTFKDNVSEGLYSELPDIKDIDFCMLNDEDEWFLLFNYIFLYNSILEKCINIENEKCIIAPHQLCSFLSSFVIRFSMYYRKVRVLLKPKAHLIPKIHARIHLLIIIQKILRHGLSILDIQLLTEM